MNMSQYNEIASITESICETLGMNVAHDWDGIESAEDIILYLKSIKVDLTRERLKKITEHANIECLKQQEKMMINKFEDGQLVESIWSPDGSVLDSKNFDRMVISMENGQMALVPFVNVFKDGKLVYKYNVAYMDGMKLK